MAKLAVLQLTKQFKSVLEGVQKEPCSYCTVGQLFPFPGSISVMGLMELNSHFHPKTLVYISTKTAWC